MSFRTPFEQRHRVAGGQVVDYRRAEVVALRRNLLRHPTKHRERYRESIRRVEQATGRRVTTPEEPHDA